VKIFVSHAALDGELAQLIEQQIRLANPKADVFRTTRVGQIPAGKEWLAFIQQNLRDADAYIVILTPWSMTRPWIAFETGAAWYSEKPLIPVVAGSLEKAEVVEPLRSLQLLSLEQPAEATQAFRELGLQLGDATVFCSAVISLCAKARSAALVAEDWVGIEHDGSFYAWDGPIEDLRQGQPKPSPDGLIERLRAENLDVASGSYPDLDAEYSRGYSIVWLIDLKHRRHHYLLSSSRMCLLVRPKTPPSA
jgi:hypothetical protein